MATIEKKKKKAGSRFLSAVGGTMARMPGVASKSVGGFVDQLTGVPNTIGGTIGTAGKTAKKVFTQSPVATGQQIGSFLAERPEGGMTRGQKLGRAILAPGKATGKFYAGKTNESLPPATSMMQEPVERPAPQAMPIPTPQAMPQKQTGAMGVPTSMLYRTSSAEALKKLFPGSDAAARAYGLRTIGQMQAAEPGSVQAASLEAERLRGKARTIGSPTVRREVEGQAAELERQAPRARELEARQKMVETQVAGEMAKAMAGDQMAMETLKAQYYKSDAATKSKMFGDMLKGLNPDGTMEPAEYLTKANELAQQLGIGAGAEQGAEQGVEGGISAIGELAGYDTNQDGLLDGDEAKSALDFANTVMAKYNTLTPEQQTAAKTDPKFINAQAILAAVKQKASKKAKQVIG